MNYLTNCWYAAAYGQELGEAPLARKILGLDLVFYRYGDGAIAALNDRCPHRFAPLSMGKVCDGQIECPYHGLRFGADGACVHNPHYAALPAAARVKSYPVMERHGLIWVWMGSDEPDHSHIPPVFEFLDDPNLAIVRGYLNVKANYQLIVDNLLDLTHVPYLHPAFSIPGFSNEQRLNSTTTKLVAEGDRVTIQRWRLNCPPSTPNREIFGFHDEFVNARSHMHWMPPSLIYFDAGVARLDESDEQGLHMPAMHAITPETELSSHYFFLQGRNMRVDEPAIGDAVLAMLENAFRNEDEPMIEAQQARMGAESDIMALDPVLLKSDGAPVSARRILSRLIALEGERGGAAR